MTTSEAMWCHGQVCRQPIESDTKEEDKGPDNDDASTLDLFTPEHPLHLGWFLRLWLNTVHYGVLVPPNLSMDSCHTNYMSLS